MSVQSRQCTQCDGFIRCRACQHIYALSDAEIDRYLIKLDRDMQGFVYGNYRRKAGYTASTQADGEATS